MATLRATVQIGSAALPDTFENRRKIFVCAGRTTRNTGFGNTPHRVPPIGQHRFDLNNPSMPGAISVSSFNPVFFSSEDFTDSPDLAGQVNYLIEAGYVVVVDMAAPGTPLNRAAIEAYV